MAKKFASLMTEKGKTLIADAIAGGKTISLKYFAVGDGNGAEVTPSSSQTALVNEVARVEINSIKETDAARQVVAAEAIIPANKGGFWIREAGIFTSDGVLVAVSQMPVTYKPAASEGASSSQIVRMLMAISNASAVNITVDDSLVIATEDYVNSRLKEHEKSRNHPDATLDDKGFVQLSSATDSDDETMAATPRAVKAANDNADTRLSASENLSDLSDEVSARDNLGLGVLATKDSLTAADVDAYSKEEADAKYIPESSIGVHTGQVMAVNSRYPSENNNTNAFMSNNTPTLAAAESGHKPSLEVSNNGNKSAAAVLMLHREGDFATYFGLDTDNSLAIGGYSFDKVRHRIFHEGFTGNLSTQADAQSRADTAYNNAVNQINAAFGFATAGYWNVGHNGQIFQSGRVTVQGSLHVTFPAAFPNAATCIVLTAGTTDNVSVTYNNDNAAGFDVYVRGGSGTDSVSWFAMGY